jgi:hypothetical protein
MVLCWSQVVVEFEGVIVEDTSDLHSKAWLQLADEEGKGRPLQFALKKAEGMKNEQVICHAVEKHVLCASCCLQFFVHEPHLVKRCMHHEEILQ